MENFAVIDTETNWNDKVMSIGAVIADADTFEEIAERYYIITPECTKGGMYASVLQYKGQKIDALCSRKEVLHLLNETLRTYRVDSVFAYNAAFDYQHLRELQQYRWCDIMRIAAYRQYNRAIPDDAECYQTGRLKHGYGVESIMRMLSGVRTYTEVHNALCDARDELKIMKLLGQKYECYRNAELSIR